MIATCPRCQSDFSWNENDAGKVSSCPTCQLELTLPEHTPETLGHPIQSKNEESTVSNDSDTIKTKYAVGAIIAVVVFGFIAAFSGDVLSKPWGGVLYGSNYESGKPESRGYVVDGIMEGEWKGWYENGNLQRIEFYKDGLLHGKQTIWREDGSKILQRTYESGIPVGAIHYWDEDGKVTSEPVHDSLIQHIFRNN